MAEPLRPPALPLAERLVAASEAILAEEGLEGLTLRRVAARAGVTHGAPLRHYRSFAALRSEVAARGFRQLSEAMEAGASGVPPGGGPLARLAACARAYLGAAVAAPALFALMFRPELLDFEHGDLARAAAASFDRLVGFVRAAQDAGWHTGRPTRRLAGTLWSAIHGLSLLWAQGAYPAVVPDTSLEEALASTLDLVLQNPHPRSSP
jgi:AcrR family transcriptional regulator